MHETIHRYLKKKNEKGNEEREREETSMKKFKKLLAGLLAGAMMLGSMSATAFAADATTTTKMPTIDENRTGSLTIHKYEYNGTDTANKGTDSETDTANKGTGSETDTANKATGSETDTVPEGAKKLSGIKFEITKAYGLDSFYKTDSIKLPTVKEAKTEIEKNHTSPVEGTTDKGIVKFDNLELGIYLVHESDSSAQPQITGKVADFLVSIPMTNKDEDDWLYDVHVFPKNSSTYAGVTLQKKGKIGSADATVLEGATFVLQKKGTGVSWTTITNNNKGVAIGPEGVLTTDAEGKITVSDLAPGSYRFVETGVPRDTGYIMNGRDTKEFEITTTGDVKIGNEVVNTNQNPIEVINYKPNVEKEVKNAAGNWGNDSDYSAGDEVPYRVTVDVPSNIEDLREFVVTDTMEHQTYKSGSLKIYSDEGLSTEILNGEYTVNKNGTRGWSISFNTYNVDTGKISSLLTHYKGSKIYISFTTVLNEDALTTSEGNPNTVKLEYSNKILPSSNEDGNPNTPGTPGKDEITDQATVYTFKIAVEKVDAEKDSIKLKGVKFDLYRKLTDDASGENVLTDPVKGLTGTYEKVKADLTTNDAGEVSVNGLENGTYYLVETKTKDRYNLLKAPVEVKIEAEYVTTKTTNTDTKSGKTTTTTVVSNTKFDKTGDNGVFKTVIKNSQGFTLPTTGGMGTIAITALGVALAFAGVLIIGASRKKTVK